MGEVLVVSVKVVGVTVNVSDCDCDDSFFQSSSNAISIFYKLMMSLPLCLRLCR
jgi:hypothetical protein